MTEGLKSWDIFVMIGLWIKVKVSGLRIRRPSVDVRKSSSAVPLNERIFCLDDSITNTEYLIQSKRASWTFLIMNIKIPSRGFVCLWFNSHELRDRTSQHQHYGINIVFIPSSRSPTQPAGLCFPIRFLLRKNTTTFWSVVVDFYCNYTPPYRPPNVSNINRSVVGINIL